MRTQATALSLLVTLSLGCSASHPGETPDAGPSGVDAAHADAASGDDGGGDVDSGGPILDGGRDTGSIVHACDGPSGCTLRPESCCGLCGAPTPDDLIALPDSEVESYVASVCAGVGCPECAGMLDPYLLATCRASACVAVNLHVDPLTECTTTSDCQLAPSECCACGLLGVGQVIAFNPARGSIAALTCDPDADCPPCVPDFSGTSAICNAGRCEVRGAD
jgi:hypothetical protein